MTKRKILYVEDDQEVRENYTLILETYFGEVVSSSCGKEALELYKKDKFSLLILDINLPHISGLEIAQYIRKKDQDTKIIMLTAYSDRDRLLKAVNLKLEAYLIKPVNRQVFVETVRKFLKNEAVQNSDNNSIILDNNLIWNKKEKSLNLKNENIKLTKKEIILMTLLIENINTYVGSELIILKVWEDEFTDFSHNHKLTQLVYRLNKKLIDLTKSSKPLISNTYSVGYKIEKFENKNI